jgi:hypothetical protein
MLKSTTLRARKKASAACGHQVKKESVEVPMAKLTEVKKGGVPLSKENALRPKLAETQMTERGKI